MVLNLKADRYRNGRGNSIHDNVSGGEMWVINDEDYAKIDQGFETCVTLMRSNEKDSWVVYDVDEGFKSEDKWLQDLVDDYNRQKNLVELEELIEQMQYEESFRV
jgi:hypothetical protein